MLFITDSFNSGTLLWLTRLLRCLVVGNASRFGCRSGISKIKHDAATGFDMACTNTRHIVRILRIIMKTGNSTNLLCGLLCWDDDDVGSTICENGYGPESKKFIHTLQVPRHESV